jgi:hypothetical protein
MPSVGGIDLRSGDSRDEEGGGDNDSNHMSVNFMPKGGPFCFHMRLYLHTDELKIHACHFISNGS